VIEDGKHRECLYTCHLIYMELVQNYLIMVSLVRKALQNLEPVDSSVQLTDNVKANI
jgi:hypothetical protein